MPGTTRSSATSNETSYPSDTPRKAHTFSDFLHSRIQNLKGRSLEIDKTSVRAVAKELNIKTPAQYAVFEKISDIRLASLPDTFVLKPIHGKASRSVYLLRRLASSRDLYWDQLRNVMIEEKQLLEIIGSHGESDRDLETGFMAEEFIGGENGPKEIPYDYKIFAFLDHVPFVVLIDRNTATSGVAFFGEDFSTDISLSSMVGSDWKKLRKRKTAEKPENWEDMVKVCYRIVRHLRNPFLRIDLFTNGREVYLGELTPCPGGSYYGNVFYLLPEFDEILGRYWRRGCEAFSIPIPEVVGEAPSAEKRRQQQKLYRERRHRETIEAKYNVLKEEKAALRAKFDGVVNSWSWRVTAPLRQLRTRANGK